MARGLTERHIAAHPFTQSRVWWRTLSAEQVLLLGICVLALLRGLAYVAIIPPWEQYDEPTHFEYAALIAAHGAIPTPETVDPELRYAIARSMQTHSTWGPHNTLAENTKDVPFIGVTQAGHAPFYYVLASLAIRLNAGAPVEIQLYSMRLLSIVLYLITIGLAAIWLRLALPGAPTLRLTALALVATTPSYGILMTAASNDVLTSLAGMLLLLLSALVIRAGWSWRSVVLTACAVGLPFLVKRTIFPLALLPLIAIALAAPPRLRVWLWRGLAFALCIGVVILAYMPTGAAYWITSATERMHTTTVTDAHDGRQALLVSANNPEDKAGVQQSLSGEAVYILRGNKATVGVWARAITGTVQVQLPYLISAAGATPSTPITLDTRWHFISSVVPVTDQTLWLDLHLDAPRNGGAVLYDSAVVADSNDPTGMPAQTSATQLGARASGSVTNLLRNPSMEHQALLLQLPALLEERLQHTLPSSTLDIVISSLSDWQFIRDTYPSLLVWLFRTFWVVIGRGITMLFADLWAWMLAFLGGLAIMGGLWRGAKLAIAQRQRGRQWRTTREQTDSSFGASASTRLNNDASVASQKPIDAKMILLGGIAACLAWSTAILRVHLQPELPSPMLYFPVGRYAFAGFVPTIVLLVLGISALLPRRWHARLGIVLTTLWMLLDLSAVATILWYYYSVR